MRTPQNIIRGEHDGTYNFLVGQTVKGEGHTRGEDSVVLGYDSAKNAVIVGPRADLGKNSAMIGQIHWLRPMASMHSLKLLARSAPHAPEIACRVTLFENATARVEFDERVATLAPGRAIAFYEGPELLGGGFIDQVGITD
jgi:tRNA-specific 2-thiouridylase